MKIIIKSMLLLVLFSNVASCTSSTTVRHGTGSMATVITTAGSEKESYRMASEKARDICMQQDSKVNIIDKESICQGIDKSQQHLIKIAHDILPKSKTAGPYTPPEHEYKTTLTFKCE